MPLPESLLGLALLLSSIQGAPQAPESRAGSRLVVLGFDGGDARLVQQLLEQGQLPNLQKIRDTGSYFPLRTTNPAQSPVSWASFNTGMGPDTTNIYDFVCRVNEDRDTHAPLAKPTPALSLTYPVTESADRILPAPLRSAFRIPLIVGAGLALFGVFFALFRLGAKFPARMALVLSLVLGVATSAFAAAVARYLPKSVVVPRTEMRGTPFWDHLDGQGIATVGLSVPMVFPLPEAPFAHAKILAGLGVPDARQSWGDWFVLSTDKAHLDRLVQEGDMGGIAVHLAPDASHDRGGARAYVGTIEGPKNFWLEQRFDDELRAIAERFASGGTSPDENRELARRKEEIERERGAGIRASVEILARVAEDKKRVAIELEHGQVDRPDGGDLQVGDWSPLVRVKFRLNPLISLSTLVAFRVLSIDPLTIFLKPINLDPKAPPPTAPISTPREFSGEIASDTDVRDFETLGWACATNALKDNAIDEETLLGDIERILGQRERILNDRIQRGDWRLLYMVFGETDRVQHLMFRHIDPLHPLYSQETANREVTFFGKRMPVKDTIAEIYRQADRIVGEAWARVNDGRTQMLVVSDHGFSSFRTGVHLNKWLHSHGYLAVKDPEKIGKVDVAQLFNPNNLFAYVDWSATRAYSLGLGKIYLNVKGRESRGIVDPKDAEALEREIAKKLEEDVDPDTKKPFVKRAYLAREIYPDRGKNMRPGDRDNSEDLVLGFAEGYRVSWESSLGGFTDTASLADAKGLLEPGRYLVRNRHKWSGDHCSVDPSLVTGIFFSTMRLAPPTDAPAPDVRHCAPTILHYFGAPIPAGLRAPLLPAK